MARDAMAWCGLNAMQRTVERYAPWRERQCVPERAVGAGIFLNVISNLCCEVGRCDGKFSKHESTFLYSIIFGFEAVCLVFKGLGGRGSREILAFGAPASRRLRSAKLWG